VQRVPEPVASSSRKRASVSASAATQPTTSSVGVAVHQFESVGDQPLGDTADVGAAHVDDERGIGVGEARSVQVECAVVDGVTASAATRGQSTHRRRLDSAPVAGILLGKRELTNGERGGK
jgi:hypothetical protein